jgi:hypothetical protein
MPTQKECTFNIFIEGRKYTGHHRKYVLESAMAMVNSPTTAEGIRLREKLGYFGHGRREMARKVAIAEVEIIKGVDGKPFVMENVPSNVTLALSMDKDGTVKHTQEFLINTEPGRVAMGCDKSRVGGFSWACGGVDGGAMLGTRINSFEGFDYVMNPGFSANRGYILESATAEARGLILESICRTAGITDKQAEGYLNYWAATEHGRIAELEEKVEQAAIYEAALSENLDRANARIIDLSKNADAGHKEAERRQIITEAAKTSVIVVPGAVLESIISMAGPSDFQNIVGFFESARRVNLSGLPVGGARQPEVVRGRFMRKEVEFGTAEAAADLDGDDKW